LNKGKRVTGTEKKRRVRAGGRVNRQKKPGSF